MIIQVSAPQDSLATLRNAKQTLLVRSVLHRDDALSEALCDVAAGDRRDWNPQHWHSLLKDLRRSPLRLAEWLDLNS